MFHLICTTNSCSVLYKRGDKAENRCDFLWAIRMTSAQQQAGKQNKRACVPCPDSQDKKNKRKIRHRPAAIAEKSLSRTCASTRRCLIRVMDFCSVSFSGGQKVCTSSTSSSSSGGGGAGPVTMKLAIWSFRLLRDCTAGRGGERGR